MSINSTFLEGILLNKDYCSLCFQVFDQYEDLVQIHDTVLLENNEDEEITNLLSYLIGNNLSQFISPLSTICQECLKLAIQCYSFIKSCKTNIQNLNKICNTLCNSFVTNKVIPDRSKSLFISINPNDFTNKVYYHCEVIPSCSEGLRIFKSIKDGHAANINFIHHNIHKTKISRTKCKIRTVDMLLENTTSKLNCKVCSKEFPKICNLRQHYMRVHAPKEYKCTKCPKSFGSAHFLRSHQYDSHCKVICSECGKTFNNRHTLKMHEISHKLRLVCPDCGRIYRRRITYNKHIELKICEQDRRKSNTEAKFTCDNCGKKYSTKNSLRVHIKFEHGNGKAHVCMWCNRKFHAQSILKSHILKHTQEKKFNCDICNGKFVTKMSLLYHVRTHTGETPYQCDLCDKRFLSLSRKADHIKYHHTSASLECDVCHNKFKTGASLRKHRKRHFNPSTRLLYIENVQSDNQ